MIIIAGNVYVNPFEVEAFVSEARTTIPLGLKNKGCISISFTLDDKDAGSMLVLERWKDQASLDKHLAQPEVVALFTKWGPKMRNEVKKYDALNERDPRDK
ncbi:putative quinol monooxygenase [Leeuwenhoekiella sp. H156]|uniref:putative quinol monooxygenase n=1 Tax=Leeuwenhoekiella sp. H156 TaxID=3450128 RepID=UPI003FA4CD23